jgi:hypothetical protein
MAAGAPIDETSFELRDGTAQSTACGPGDSFCRRSIDSDYETQMKSDPCSIQTTASDDEKTSNYYLWLPQYRQKPCEGSGYHLCDTTSRFGPRKVAQESFLQGRGQVTGPRSCFASGLRFLPQDEFPEDPKPQGCHDMTLFARSTQVRKSCGSVSEVDMGQRLRPLPGSYTGAFTPFILESSSLVPNVTDQFVPGNEGRKGVTLSTKRYPSWEEIKARQDSYR